MEYPIVNKCCTKSSQSLLTLSCIVVHERRYIVKILLSISLSFTLSLSGALSFLSVMSLSLLALDWTRPVLVNRKTADMLC